MATLVAENPDAGADETRSDLVGEVERGPGGPVRRRGKVTAAQASAGRAAQSGAKRGGRGVNVRPTRYKGHDIIKQRGSGLRFEGCGWAWGVGRGTLKVTVKNSQLGEERVDLVRQVDKDAKEDKVLDDIETRSEGRAVEAVRAGHVSGAWIDSARDDRCVEGATRKILVSSGATRSTHQPPPRGKWLVARRPSLVARRWMRLPYDRTAGVMKWISSPDSRDRVEELLDSKVGDDEPGRANQQMKEAIDVSPRSAALHSLLSLCDLLLLCFAEELVLDLLSGGGRLALSDGGHGGRAGELASW